MPKPNPQTQPLSREELERDPASLLHLSTKDPLILKLEMLRLLGIGYAAKEIAHAFDLSSEEQLHTMLAEVKLAGTSMMLFNDDSEQNKRRGSFWSQDRMGQICSAAVQVFHERGYHGATMRDIAECVGIRAPSIYNHFPTKEALLHHVMMHTMERLLERVKFVLAAASRDPVSRLSVFIGEHIRFHLEHAHEAAVADNELGVLSDENRASVVALRDRYEKILRDLLWDGLEQVAFAETEIGLASMAILTMCTAVSLWYRPDGPLSPQDVAIAYTRFALRMIGSVDMPKKEV